MRGDRHGEATVIPYDAAGASARACGSVEGSTLGAAEVRRLHHSRTTPDSERCSSYETAHRPRAPLPCAIRSGGGPGGVLPLMGVAFPRGLPSHELATSSYVCVCVFYVVRRALSLVRILLYKRLSDWLGLALQKAR